MMYALLTIGDMFTEDLPPILAEAFKVAIHETDVSDHSTLDDRNWDALITCDCEALDGDLTWLLEIYATAEVKEKPTMQGLALHLAKRFNKPFFFAWKETVPWVRRVAFPDGRLTLARVSELDDTGSGLSVEVAEEEIPGMPHVRVDHLPEVVRAYDVGTPLSDSVLPRESRGERRKVRGLLVSWERLCVRMESNWPPEGWYSASMYREDLEHRDKLELAMISLEKDEHHAVQQILAELDQRYLERTIDDGGVALASAISEDPSRLTSRPWYWRRRPLLLPWSTD
jgi:hypothetical protein